MKCDQIIQCRKCKTHVSAVLYPAETDEDFDVLRYECTNCGKISLIPNPFLKLYDENGKLEKCQTGKVL